MFDSFVFLPLSTRAYFKCRAYIKIILKNHARCYFAGRSYYRGNTVAVVDLIGPRAICFLWGGLGPEAKHSDPFLTWTFPEMLLFVVEKGNSVPLPTSKNKDYHNCLTTHPLSQKIACTISTRQQTFCYFQVKKCSRVYLGRLIQICLCFCVKTSGFLFMWENQMKKCIIFGIIILYLYHSNIQEASLMYSSANKYHNNFG